MSIKDLIEQGKNARNKKVRKRALKTAAVGAAIGITVGAAAGILLAPKAGKETRAELANAAREIPDKTNEIIKKTKEKFEEVKVQLKEKKSGPVEDLAEDNLNPQ